MFVLRVATTFEKTSHCIETYSDQAVKRDYSRPKGIGCEKKIGDKQRVLGSSCGGNLPMVG
jgi:hypothetical protein